MKLVYPHLSIYLIAFFLSACNSHSDKEKDIKDNTVVSKEPIEQPVAVKVLTLNTHTFNRELLANGKVEAVRKANLKFSADGIIKDIFITEGERVRAGQLLANLDNLQQQRIYRQNKLRYNQAVLDYEDQLLRLGYHLKDTAKIDRSAKNIAKLRSGLSNTELELQKAGTDLSHTSLNAPFSGKIANLKAKIHSGSSTFEYICTLIDDSELLVDFLVLEQELDFIRASKTVKIVPFNNENSSYTGTIVSINPMVDKSGMINVKARIHNTNGQLLDGISVRVIAQQMIPKQLSIPKSALLERQGRKVVFTVNDKVASWNYVETAYENSAEYAIKSGLKPGDQVIYDGNFNLAHERAVKVIEQQ